MTATPTVTQAMTIVRDRGERERESAVSGEEGGLVKGKEGDGAVVDRVSVSGEDVEDAPLPGKPDGSNGV